MQKNYGTPKIILFNAITILLWFSGYTYVPIFSVYLGDMGISYSMIGVILSSYGFMQLLFRIPFGILSDALNMRKAFIFLGLLASAISSIGLYFSYSPYTILLFRGISGIAVSTWAIYIATYVGYFSIDEKAKSIGHINSSFSFGQMLATFTGGIIAASYGARSSFILSACAAAIGIFFCFFLPESKAKEKGILKTADFIHAAKDKNLLFFSAMGAIMQVGTYAGIYGFMPTLLRNLGADNRILGLAVTLATISSMLAAFISGTFFKRVFGLKNSAIIGFISTAVSLVLMVYVLNIPGMLVLSFIGGFGKGLLTPTLTTMAISRINPSIQSTAIAFFQAVYSIGMIGGPLIIGLFADRYGLAFGFWIATIICVLGAVLTARKEI